MADRIRIVIASPGDDTGATAVARALRDAGVEVVWTGPQQSPEQIVRTVVQEDADAVGVCGGGDVESVVALLADHDAQDVVVLGIGLGSDAGPAPTGVAATFPTGPDTADDVVDWVRENLGVGGTA